MSSQLDYYEFMGYNSAELRRRYAVYAERFPAGARVADLGCGRGEFLELLAARGVDGVGVDADEGMVGAVSAKGLTAVKAEAVAYLSQNAISFDGVFASHLIEHLPPEGVRSLVQVAAAALRPGGRLILVTPNPNNLQMQLRDFWIDLQHVRFYSQDIVRWIVHDAGLRDIEVGENAIYRTGPGLASQPLPNLPASSSRGYLGLKPGIKRLSANVFRISPFRRRLYDLEKRVNALTAWMKALYPPGEYFVTAVR
jgi:SAM-dependent methyltransferase